MGIPGCRAAEHVAGGNMLHRAHCPQMTLAVDVPALFLFRKGLMGKREGGAALSREIALPVSEPSRPQKK